MRPAAVLRLLAVLVLGVSAALGLAAFLSFRAALRAKIDRAAAIEGQAVRPAAAARLAAALLETRLAAVTESPSRAIASAFGHSDAARALANYRAAGGDSEIASEAEKAIARGSEPQSDIALMRAIRGLRSEANRLPHLSVPPPPPAASRGASLMAAAGVAAAAAALLAYAAGRTAAKP